MMMLDYLFCPATGATEDAINQARDAFHAHLDSKKAQALMPEYTDEELLMEDNTEFEREYSGI
jgi:hypothetical protein